MPPQVINISASDGYGTFQQRTMTDTPQTRDPKRYERTKLWIGLANLVIYILAPVIVLVSGASASIRDTISDEITGIVVLGAVAYIVLASIALELLTLPIGYFSGHVLERRYGLTRRSVGGWTLDWLKGLAVQTVMLAIFVACLYALLAADPDYWWVWASLLFSVISVFMAAIAPIVLMPIFFKFEPLPDGDLKQRLERLSTRLNTFVQGAYIWKLGDRTVKANAALAGWGKTRRIIISDTLIESHDADEIEVIIAHELGHHVNGDIWRGIGVQVVIIFVSMWLVDLALGAWSGSFEIGWDVARLCESAVARVDHYFRRRYRPPADQHLLPTPRDRRGRLRHRHHRHAIRVHQRHGEARQTKPLQRRAASAN